jgi:arylsulfatase A-like enzyme
MIKKTSFFIFLLFLSIGFFLVKGPTEKENEKPNVILIMVDALRPDHLGCYGYSRPTSPHIDALAGHSDLFTHVFSQSSWTIPSNYSLLTSLYTPEHKMQFWDSVLDSAAPNLFSSLKGHGFVLGVFGNQRIFFENLRKNFGLMLDEVATIPSAPSIAESALHWAETRKEPFFLWVYYLGSHRPYRSPEPYRSLYPFKPGGRLPIRSAEKSHHGGWDYIPALIVQDGIDDPNYYIAQYDGAIRYADEEIGKLLDGLKKRGLYDKSLIILTSDHGESLGEHHFYFNHIFTLFDEIIRVPLIVKRPRQAFGKKINENAALIDIFPTVLDEIGANKIPGLQGVSLKEGAPQRRALFSFYRDITALIQGPWKLIQYPESLDENNEYIKIFFPAYPGRIYQLFDLESDPGEVNDLSQKKGDVFERMKLLLAERQERLKASGYRLERFQSDEVFKQKIRSLGYAQ